MFRPRGDDIDSGGIDIAVTENIRQLRHIMVDAVKRPSEQVPQTVGKHLAGGNLRPFTQGLHLPPDIGSVNGSARSGHKHRAGADIPLLRVALKLFSQCGGQKHGPRFPLTGHNGLSLSHSFHRDVLQFAHPYAGGADTFQQQRQTLAAFFLGRFYEPYVFCPTELLFLRR